jgi:hypothetical protein
VLQLSIKSILGPSSLLHYCFGRPIREPISLIDVYRSPSTDLRAKKKPFAYQLFAITPPSPRLAVPSYGRQTLAYGSNKSQPETAQSFEYVYVNPCRVILAAADFFLPPQSVLRHIRVVKKTFPFRSSPPSATKRSSFPFSALFRL